MSRFVVLASGTGSGFVSIAQSCRSGVLSRSGVTLTGLICNRELAPVRDRAEELGVPARLVSNGPNHDRELLDAIRELGADWLVCAGWMKKISDSVLKEFWDVELQVYRVVNIHPSLLPAFVGVDGYLQAWNNGNQTTGATVHLIDTEIDTGPICAQEAFSIQDCTSIEEVRRLGQAVEHRLYPETLSWILNRQFSYQLTTETRRIHVRKN